MGAIRLENVEKWFGDLQVIRGLSLEIEDGELVVFVGPSGCGKSTLLRMIAGLEETSYGRILIDDRDVTDKIPSERALSMVFQSYALYPHMSVRQNIGFALKTAGVDRASIDRKVSEAASILELDDYLERRPKELSGGQRQRVAIGRAIVREPKGFLFDEPLSNLDAALRVQMRFEIAKLHKKLGATMVYVTHDQVEAMTLADKIVVLRDGVIEQVGTPHALYETPRTLFVAQFIGSPKMNIMPCTAQGSDYHLPEQGGGRHGLQEDASGIVHLGVRPEHIRFAATADGQCRGRIEVVEYLGADRYVYVNCEGVGVLNVRVPGGESHKVGSEVGLAFAVDQLHFFTQDGQAVR
ncbi:MAG: sn-glycerol-3-phosphate ABC transporter ATP-binding protein UgpC [Hyphomicrobiales bacterium]|nr:sn-glycerol-3-phosphate ABC transporter ATP-binding protein UgpC [Hyphomicrobiales bacterium]